MRSLHRNRLPGLARSEEDQLFNGVIRVSHLSDIVLVHACQHSNGEEFQSRLPLLSTAALMRALEPCMVRNDTPSSDALEMAFLKVSGTSSICSPKDALLVPYQRADELFDSGGQLQGKPYFEEVYDPSSFGPFFGLRRCWADPEPL